MTILPSRGEIMKNNKKKIAVVAGSIVTSMVAGFILGCLHTKKMDYCRCIIDNIEDLV